jgi:hypothetical protein
MNRLLLISLRGAPGHVHLGAVCPRPVYGELKPNSARDGPLIEPRGARDRFVTEPVWGASTSRVSDVVLGDNI